MKSIKKLRDVNVRVASEVEVMWRQCKKTSVGVATQMWEPSYIQSREGGTTWWNEDLRQVVDEKREFNCLNSDA